MIALRIEKVKAKHGHGPAIVRQTVYVALIDILRLDETSTVSVGKHCTMSRSLKYILLFQIIFEAVATTPLTVYRGDIVIDDVTVLPGTCGKYFKLCCAFGIIF